MFDVENAASEAERIKDKRIIIAGPQTTFRAGVARVLSLEHDMQIVAQCEEHTEIRVAVETLKPSALIVSLSILCDHPDLLHPLKRAAIGVIAVAPTPEHIPAEMAKYLHGTISRDISINDLVHSVRHVARGHRDSQSLVHSASAPVGSDVIGKCVCNHLTRRELQVVGLIARAYKNKQIAECLGTKEQVVKNYTRRLFVKCGVTDRLGLAVFTANHPILAEAGERASTLLIEARSAHLLVEFPTKSSPRMRLDNLLDVSA
jgi:DNA-binding NarL/FixJ family response regulator